MQIGFCLEGGVGDVAIASALLQAIVAHLDLGQVDIFSNQPMHVVQTIFHDVPVVRDIYPYQSVPGCADLYSLFFHLNEFCGFRFYENSPKPNMLPEPLKSFVLKALFRDQEFGLAYQLRAGLNNQTGRHAVLKGLNRYSLPFYLAGLPDANPYTQIALDQTYAGTLEKFKLTHKQYLTVHDGWDAVNNVFEGGKRPTKVWPVDYWKILVQNLKQRYPELHIVQLGTPASASPIEGVDQNLVGQTNLPEALWLAAGSRLHIDSESGMVHLAHAVGTKSVVMFGPTNADFFAYIDNMTVAAQNCTNCWWLKEDWMKNCIRGLVEPECMHGITPERVLAAVDVALSDQKS